MTVHDAQTRTKPFLDQVEQSAPPRAQHIDRTSDCANACPGCTCKTAYDFVKEDRP